LAIAASTGWLLVTLMAQAAPPSPAAETYYRAREQARSGHPEQALGLLEGLVERWPDDAFADDAMAERARILEQDLKAPERALSAWRELAAKHPDSRLARRARARVDFLQQHLDQGGQVLAAYQDLLRRGQSMPAEQAIAEMDALLEAHPDFSLRAEGRMFAAGLLARAGQVERARLELERIVAGQAGQRVAGLALIQLGQLAESAGDLDAAVRWYRDLGSMPGEDWTRASSEGMARVDKLRWRGRSRTAALGLWAAALLAAGVGLGLMLWRGRLTARRLWPPPLEATAYVVVMGVLVALVWGRAVQTTWVLAWMAALLTPLLLLNGWLLRAVSLRAWGLSAWCLAAIAICAAVTYAAIDLAGMTDQVLHTLRFGGN